MRSEIEALKKQLDSASRVVEAAKAFLRQYDSPTQHDPAIVAEIAELRAALRAVGWPIEDDYPADEIARGVEDRR